MKEQVKKGVSWGLVVVGLAVFLQQAGETLASHETWALVFTPHGVGDLLQALVGGLLAAAGAAGIKRANSSSAR